MIPETPSRTQAQTAPLATTGTTPHDATLAAPLLPSDVATLQAQLRLARAQNADLNRQVTAAREQADVAALTARLDKARVAYRTLKDTLSRERQAWAEERGQLRAQPETPLKAELRAVQQELDRVRWERDAATRDAAFAERMRAMWESLAKGLPSSAYHAPDPTLEPLLKHLLTLAHPDKWSQGQPATALAHELAVVLNDARAHLEGLP